MERINFKGDLQNLCFGQGVVKTSGLVIPDGTERPVGRVENGLSREPGFVPLLLAVAAGVVDDAELVGQILVFALSFDQGQLGLGKLDFQIFLLFLQEFCHSVKG